MSLFPYQVVHTINNKKAAIYVIEFTGPQHDRETYRQFVSWVRAVPKPYNGHFNNSPALRFRDDASGSIAFHALPDDEMLKRLLGCKPDAHVVGTALAAICRNTFGDKWVDESSPAPEQKQQPQDISSEGRSCERIQDSYNSG